MIHQNNSGEKGCAYACVRVCAGVCRIQVRSLAVSGLITVSWALWCNNLDAKYSIYSLPVYCIVSENVGEAERDHTVEREERKVMTNTKLIYYLSFYAAPARRL